MRRFLIWTVLVTFLVSFAHNDDAEARRRRRSRRHSAKRAKVINEKKLFERVGGTKGLTGIVDEWVRLNLADPRVSPLFAKIAAKPERIGKMRHQLGDQLCELSDGPCVYKPGEIEKENVGTNITEEQFLVVSNNLFKSMQKAGVPEREKNEMLGRLNEIRPESLGDGT